jgi:hypothetical protein
VIEPNYNKKGTTMEVMTNVSLTTPRRVLTLAAELGAHADCVAADIDGACHTCVDILNVAMHKFYGHLEIDESLLQIIRDLREDREND